MGGFKMPVLVADTFPALRALEKEHLFLMNHKRALNQDIRPLRIAVLNLMPDKLSTERQLLRLISNSLIQIEVTFLHPKSHNSKNTDRSHLEAYYQTFDQVKNESWDGMIVTGAPVENLKFEDVNYWTELKEIFDFVESNVNSTLFICWGAQAALYHYYGIEKYPLHKKTFGVFEHRIVERNNPLSRGFDDVFKAPHSRHTFNRREDLNQLGHLDIVAESAEAGVLIASTKDLSKVFVTGHPEYDVDTLHREYTRDLESGLAMDKPIGYYPENNAAYTPIQTWRGHANLLYANWLNYCVYQSDKFIQK